MASEDTKLVDAMSLNGATLQIFTQGTGEPVLLVHGGILADGMAPLMREPALTKHYRPITFHRRGYGRSSQAVPPFTIADQARDALGVLERSGAERAHVVGHSLGGVIALQLAADAPQRVRSLTLIEPSLLGLIPSAPQIAQVFEALIQLYQAGDKVAALHQWMMPISGTDYRQALDQTLPSGWFQQAVVDIDTAFRVDIAALPGWQFGAEDAKRIEVPLLSVLGADHSLTFAQEIDALLHAWFPQARTLLVPQSMHWPQLTNPTALVEGLAAFFTWSAVVQAARPSGALSEHRRIQLSRIVRPRCSGVLSAQTVPFCLLQCSEEAASHRPHQLQLHTVPNHLASTAPNCRCTSKTIQIPFSVRFEHHFAKPTRALHRSCNIGYSFIATHVVTDTRDRSTFSSMAHCNPVGGSTALASSSSSCMGEPDTVAASPALS